MARTAERKLTSEEKCGKAFDTWYPEEWYELAAPQLNDDLRRAMAWVAFAGAWKFLERNAKVFIET